MRSNILQVAKAVAATLIISLLFVLLFTVIIQLFSLPASIVKPVNQVFKIIAIAVGGLIFIKGEHGLLKGLVFGVIAVILTYFLFAAIARSLSFSWKFLLEVVFGAIAGGVSGILAVNVKRKA